MLDKIIFYFIIYSFLGWCLESIYKTIILKKPTNSGFLYGPFCPMYGLGAVIMIALGRISNNVFIIFILSFIFFSLWEYVVAVVLEKLFKTKYWDYSHLKYNFQGRVCLKNSIYWGILGVLLIFVLQPILTSMAEKIPSNILIYINTILCLAIFVDFIITVFKIMFIDKKIRQVFEITDTIKEKLSELKNSTILEKAHKENLQKVVAELKEKQNILKIKVYKRIIRLRKAFPEMNSENITKFMKQKISFEEIGKRYKNIRNKRSNKNQK